MASIGIVCEGSHDYCFLKEVVDELLKQGGHIDNTFVALQPRVDATSKQIDGGGYESVRQWLMTNSGISLRNFLSPVLFATSPSYDAIIVQVDGDVADISEDFSKSCFFGNFGSVHDRVSAVRSWLLCMAKIEPRFSKSVIAAVPTLQMESWVLSGISNTASDVESKNRKLATKRILRKKYKGSAVDKVISAGKTSRSNLPHIMAKSISFSLFAADLSERFN